MEKKAIIEQFRIVKDKLLAVFPVIGPHNDIELELLLAGVKPVAIMGAEVPFPTEEEIEKNWHPNAQIRLREQQRLDEAVKQGALISRDLVVRERPDPAWPSGMRPEEIVRYYGQPDRLRDVEQLVEFNRYFLNRQPIPPGAEVPDHGKILGYRRRDRFLWEKVWTSNDAPGYMKDLIIKFNPALRASYQAEMTRKARAVVSKRAGCTLG